MAGRKWKPEQQWEQKEKEGQATFLGGSCDHGEQNKVACPPFCPAEIVVITPRGSRTSTHPTFTNC